MKKAFLVKLGILASLFILPEAEALGKGFSNPYEFTLDYSLTSEIPKNANLHVLIISSRDFNVEQGYTYERGVAKNGERQIFIVSRVIDSTYVTVYPDILSALSVFNDDKPFLIFVNGHGKNFEQAIARGFDLSDRYNLNMIMFDWPTEYFALRKTAHNARKVTKNFAITVTELDEAFSKLDLKSNKSVIFHSMGNLIARNIVRKDYLDSMPENIFQNIILNAAAVNQRNHKEWVNQLDLQDRIYIISNRDDLPLKGVKILRLTTPLGSEIKDSFSDKAKYIDFSEIAGREHNLFLGRTQVEKNHPNVYDFYFSLFNGQEVDLTNPDDFAEIPSGNRYKIL
jgi:esterase/lipase superfamily enzyme